MKRNSQSIFWTAFVPEALKKSPIFLGPIQTPNFSWAEPNALN